MKLLQLVYLSTHLHIAVKHLLQFTASPAWWPHVIYTSSSAPSDLYKNELLMHQYANYGDADSSWFTYSVMLCA